MDTFDGESSEDWHKKYKNFYKAFNKVPHNASGFMEAKPCIEKEEKYFFCNLIASFIEKRSKRKILEFPDSDFCMCQQENVLNEIMKHAEFDLFFLNRNR